MLRIYGCTAYLLVRKDEHTYPSGYCWIHNHNEVSTKLLNAKYVLMSRFAELTHLQIKKPSQQYFFVHIPKTAGTTFLRVLYQHEPHHLIYPNAYEHMIRNRGRYLLPQELMRHEDSLEMLGSKKWIVGHFLYGQIIQLNSHPQVLTFLRDPFQRVVSEIVHFKTYHQVYRALDIETIIDRIGMRLGCRSAITFGYQPSKDNLQHALDRLHQCTFVGLTEHFGASLRKCNEKLGTSFSSRIHHNRGDQPLIEEVSEIYRDRISALISVDQQFYEEGMKIFESQ